MSAEFEFVDELPADGRAKHPVLKAFAAALRARPGAWAVYPAEVKRAANAAAAINRGSNTNLSPGFEARVRGGVCYVRFVGEPKDAS